MGCGVEKENTQFSNLPNVVKTFGADKTEVINFIIADTSYIRHEATNERIKKKTDKKRNKTYIKIQDGCDNFCTFCIVPHLRGRSKCRTIAEIVEEIRESDANEIVITGINLTAYSDGDKDLGDLCVEVGMLGIPFEISSLYINIITKEFITKLKSCKNFVPNFHLSLQSASNEILHKMNRKYTAEQFGQAVGLIRDAFPNANISVDVIVGFPTETDEDFMQTCEFCKKMKFDHIHIFPYSKRDGTVAATMPQLHSQTIKNRADKLREL